MEIEYELIKNVMRIASNSRRKHHEAQEGNPRRCRGFGHILDLLSKHDGLSQRQIADMLDIRPQSISEAIATLEERGLIRKEVNEQDRRGLLIYITEEGLHMRTELLNERVQNAKRIFSSISEEEKRRLLELLEKVTAALQENKEEC